VFADPAQHDGFAGQSTLDALGLIDRGGTFHNANQVNAPAQAVLNAHAAQISTLSGGEFTAANWFKHMTDPPYLGQRSKGGHGYHLDLLRKLRKAERQLLTLPQFKDMTPVELGHALGIDVEPHGGARPEDATADMHTFGLAIDIGFIRNTWVHSADSWDALKHSELLISGVALPGGSAPELWDKLGTDPAGTGPAWDRLHQLSDDLIAYFKLGTDDTELGNVMTARQSDTRVVKAGETTAKAATRWKGIIAADLRALSGDDFASSSGHTPPSDGFLTLPKELVVALRDNACLAWGAIDFGPSSQGSGDIMHFDTRVTGIGRLVCGGALPTQGHPCAPAP